MTLISKNPATGEILGTYEESSDDEVEKRLARAAAASQKPTPMSARARSMNRLAELLEGQRERHARRITAEMGKTLLSALAEVDKCAATCRHYAENAREFLADQTIATEGDASYVRYLPLGVILGVMPWNFPYWQVFRWAVPALMAGNVALLKHSSNVSGCSLELERLFAEAGFDNGRFQSLLIGAGRVNRLIADRRVAAVSLTGSELAGAAVASQAGAHVKKCVLELGGSDPFVVMPSAHLDKVIPKAVMARIINNGQSCIAAKRFIVHVDCYDEFLARFVEGFEALQVGDPMLPETDVGPLATEAGLGQLEQQVTDAQAQGAKVLCGGKRLSGPGYFYAPTVIADVPPAAAINREEVFGPVALVYRASDVDSAIRLANDSPYGLASSVWTQDRSEQARFIDELECGLTYVNSMVVSDPRLPFGGTKRSGYGRELGPQGALEFVNAKTVYVGGT
jgi:succinate-semialdehyde dehydrogenase / glutarate-semialdehyde dehydrogenase